MPLYLVETTLIHFSSFDFYNYHMKKLISALFILLCFSTAFLSAQFQIAKDAKKAIQKYAGFKELKARGFKINSLDKIQTAEDFYNVLLPYMIQNNKPLDNLLSINGMNFARHKNIVFENTYGTKDQLLKKGYTEDQLFYYPAAGKDMYRAGHFEWGQVTENPSIWKDVYFYNRPFMSEETAYFQVLFSSEKMFEPYYKELASKQNIILDYRMFSGGWSGQVRNLGIYLEEKKYEGKIILITDRTTKDDYIFANETKTGAWNNGVQAKGNLNWYVIGENTFGAQKYLLNADWNYRTDTLQFSPLPLHKFQYAVCEEGVGINPDVWAVGDEDILKTLEFLTGDKTIRNLVKTPFDFHNKISGKKDFFNNDNWVIPAQISQCKNNDEYNSLITEWLETKISWADFRRENQDALFNIGGWWFDVPECFQTIKDPAEYNEVFAKWIETRTAWARFIAENSEALKNSGGWWLEDPESLGKISDKKEYLSAFKNWIDLKTWWATFILDHQYVQKNNPLKIYKKDLNELFPDRTDTAKYTAELNAYLKEQSLWIDFLMPHEYVIPASYEKANNYKGLSKKIGKNCSAVPANVRDLQKTNPEEYVDQMVSYINSVAENDFEKVQMVFSIEQEILKYDGKERDKRVEKINIAKQGVGEDYDKYSENLNKLWEESGEEAKKQDWKTVLEEGICVCDGYSQLMQWFCYKLGLKCDRLFTPRDMYFAEGHAWNVVQVEGEDYLQDATWGISFLFMEPVDFYKKGHFPREPEQQLLKEPHTLEEFKSRKN